jgi:hypothetical protein
MSFYHYSILEIMYKLEYETTEKTWAYMGR